MFDRRLGCSRGGSGWLTSRGLEENIRIECTQKGRCAQVTCRTNGVASAESISAGAASSGLGSGLELVLTFVQSRDWVIDEALVNNGGRGRTQKESRESDSVEQHDERECGTSGRIDKPRKNRKRGAVNSCLYRPAVVVGCLKTLFRRRRPSLGVYHSLSRPR